MKPTGQSRLFALSGVGIAALGMALFFATHRPAEPTLELVDATNEQLRKKYEQGAGLCPWREMDADQKRFFPAADSRKEGRLALSQKQVELTKRLGRKPTGDENVQPFFRVFRQGQLIGEIITRRVRGENGAIEIVLVADPHHQPLGLRIQRHREPEDLHKRLETADFLRSCALDTEPSVCCGTGNEAIVREGVKTLRILLEEGDPGTK